MKIPLEKIRASLYQVAPPSDQVRPLFFKTNPGDYAAHDKFIGVSVPFLRKLAKEFYALPEQYLQELLESKINEERLLALLILVDQYQKGNEDLKESCYDFYLNNLKHVNNWNLVDASAHLIVGTHLHQHPANKKILVQWAKSEILWERRISIIATWQFIRSNELEWTIKIAEILLQDKHDLIHKAVGWMLREAGKRDVKRLMDFLKKNAHSMHRTMLRYAIEKFSEKEKLIFL